MAEIRGETAVDVATELLGLVPVTTTSMTGPRDGRFGLVSFRGRPRFLLPLGWPATTQSSCLSYLGLRGLAVQANRRLVAAGLRTGAIEAGGGRWGSVDRFQGEAGPDSLVAHLAEVLGQPEVAVAVGLGTVDVVWKPTLHVFAPDGTPLAFVKVGRGPVAAELVGRETAALDRWGEHPDPRLVVPELLGSTVWRGLPMALVAPLPLDAHRLPGPVSPWPVRTLDEPLPDASLDRAPWWMARREAAAADEEPTLEKFLQQVEDRHGGLDRAWARSHGDWVSWNQAHCHLGLVAWDWEYSEAGAPVGLDEVHGRYQEERVRHRRSVADALATVDEVAPSAWVADAHLVMLLTRDRELVRLGGAPGQDAAALRSAAESRS